MVAQVVVTSRGNAVAPVLTLLVGAPYVRASIVFTCARRLHKLMEFCFVPQIASFSEYPLLSS